MSVIRPTCITSVGAVAVLLFCLGSAVPGLGRILAAGTQEADPAPGSLVRVQFKRKVPTVLYQNKPIPQAAVLEVSEFPGIVADPRGYVVSYVGSLWTDLGGHDPQVAIRLSDGEEAPAEFVGIDERVSLAILRSKELARRAVVFGSLEDARKFTLFSWADNISGQADAPGYSIVPGPGGDAATGRWVPDDCDVLQITSSDFEPEKQIRVRLASDPGKANQTVGAPLLDDAGRFFGFVTGMEKAGLIRSARMLRVLGVQSTRNSLNEVIKRGTIRAGWLGVYLDDTTDRSRIQKVVDGGPAAQAGLHDGDLILKLGDSTVWSKSSLVRLLRWESPGVRVPLTIERAGERKTLQVEVGSWPVTASPKFAWAIQVPRVWSPGKSGAEVQSPEVRIYPVPVDEPLKLGLAVEPLTAQLAEFFRVPGGSGLLVTSVLPGSPASRFGFKAGDVLTQINGSKLESSTDIRRVLEASKDGLLVIGFVRDGELQTRKVLLQ